MRKVTAYKSNYNLAQVDYQIVCRKGLIIIWVIDINLQERRPFKRDIYRILVGDNKEL